VKLIKTVAQIDRSFGGITRGKPTGIEVTNAECQDAIGRMLTA
jgi:hypothetical protein